jgi:ABC-2 type transport system ATP-binding protein
VIIINRGQIVADDTLANLKSKSTTNLVRVSFKEALEAEWLNRLPAVLAVDKLDAYTWKLETKEPEQCRRQLQKMAADNNFDIVSLQSESISLEEVFRTLTVNKES